jgi:hypothetical protein
MTGDKETDVLDKPQKTQYNNSVRVEKTIMKLNIIQKQWVDKKGDTWEWEETPELREWIKRYETSKSTVTLPLTET